MNFKTTYASAQAIEARTTAGLPPSVTASAPPPAHINKNNKTMPIKDVLPSTVDPSDLDMRSDAVKGATPTARRTDAKVPRLMKAEYASPATAPRKGSHSHRGL